VDGNAIAFGHLNLKRFHTAAQKEHRDNAHRPIKGWQKFPARHTWMALHSRQGWRTVLRETAQNQAGCVPVTVITSPSTYSDSGRRLNRHFWLPDEDAVPGIPEPAEEAS
jgi:hypothetical protein